MVDGVGGGGGPRARPAAVARSTPAASWCMPGAVDGARAPRTTPGRADWEGLDTGTRALAAGGATCAIDMPLNSVPPTLDAESFDAKVAAARGRARVDFALWGGLVPGARDGMDALAERGVVGFKAFMCPSGVEEFPAADPETLGRGMERAAALGLPVAVHAEDPAIVGPRAAQALAAGRRGMRDWAASRPVAAELSAVRTALALARDTGCALHVVHVSSPAAVDLVAAARARGAGRDLRGLPPPPRARRGRRRGAGGRGEVRPAATIRPRAGGPVGAGRRGRGGPRRVGPLAGPAGAEARRRHVRGVGRDLGGADDPAAAADPRPGARAPGRACRGPGDAARRPRASGWPARAACGPAPTPTSRSCGPARPGSCGPRTCEYRHRHSPFVGRRLTARVVRTILRGVTVFGEGAEPGAAGRLVTPG